MSFIPKASLLAIIAVCLAWSADAVPITYRATLSGTAEDPPNASPGTGSALVTIDTAANDLHVMFSFADLLGTTTAAHIHGPTAMPLDGIAGVVTTTPTFPGTPLGVTTGSYDQSFDLTLASTFNSAFVTAQGGVPEASAALAAALAEGTAYLNIHTTSFGMGEIRGFLTPIPLPAALPLLLAGLLALGWAGSTRRSA